MQIELKHCENVTLEKAEFIEAKVQEMYDFVMESRKCLNDEAHTTLNWLFAIIVGGSGYAVTQIVENKMQWWVMTPIVVMVVVCVVQSIRLFHGALRASAVVPKGNEPKNLITDKLLQYDVEWMKIAEAASMQERITEILAHNRRMGSAVNQSRWAVVGMPFVAVISAAASVWFNAG
jgi:hypothetical protein